MSSKNRLHQLLGPLSKASLTLVRTVGTAATVISLSPFTAADVIDDASFFDSLPHTLLTFETNGNGNPVVLGEGQVLSMPGREYRTSHTGFRPDIAWVNDGSADFDAAQEIGGSLPISIPSSGADRFHMLFRRPIRSFGAWVVFNNTIPVPAIFTALNAAGEVIESVTFEGDLIDGTIGIADYGFMGISATEDIAFVRITKDAVIFDDLRFSSSDGNGPVLFVDEGEPGLASVRMEGGTPDGLAVLASSLEPGETVLASDLCDGVALDLQNLLTLTPVTIDPAGQMHYQLVTAQALAGQVMVQAVDIDSCQVSNVEPVGKLPPVNFISNESASQRQPIHPLNIAGVTVE